MAEWQKLKGKLKLESLPVVPTGCGHIQHTIDGQSVFDWLAAYESQNIVLKVKPKEEGDGE